MNKKYFLRDEEIHSVEEDYFRHQDVANNITKILETNKPPYNIAVIGKWGLGKSSLVNLVTDRLKENPKKYIKININAWKYEKEVLGKVFLRQVSQRLDERFEVKTEKKCIRRWWEVISKKYAKSFLKLFLEQLKGSWGFLLIYAAVMFFAYGFYKWVVLWSAGKTLALSLEFLALVFTGYCRNIAVLLFAPILLTCSTHIISNIRKHITEKAKYCLPEVNIEDYEIELQRKIKTIVKEDEEFRIVIVLDDLDRLSVYKMVEALDAIKMFINFPNCIFIVPFDDEIIKAAIDVVKNGGSEQLVQLVKSELLLDKLFQYKIYLAPLLKYDIKNYAVKLCVDNMQDFMQVYCEEKIFEKIIRDILIHGEVETPRQVKKIVNVFVTNIMIATDRENNEKVNKGYATSEKGMFTIAKLSVLQADFNEFYDLLFEVPDAIDIVLKIQEKGKDTSKPPYIPQELKDFFGIKEPTDSFGKEHDPLLNFLNRTAQYKIDNIVPYLYVAMEDIGVPIGGAKQKEFMNAAISGNLIRTRELLSETPLLIKIAILRLQQSDDINDIKNLMKCILQDISQLEKEDKVKASSDIAKRADEIAKSWIGMDEINLSYEGLLSGYEICDNKNEYKKLLEKVLLSDYADHSVEKTEVFAKYTHKMDSVEKAWFNNYIKNLLNKDLMDMDSFITLKKANRLTSEVWIESYYRYLIRNISKTENSSRIVLKQLKTTFQHMLKNKGANYCLEEMKPLYSTKYMSTVFRWFSTNVNDIDSRNLNELVRQRLSTYVVEEKEFNDLFKCVDGRIESETAEIIDKYIKTYGEKKDIARFIHKFAKNNDVELIYNSVIEVVNWIFTEPNKEKVQYLRLVMKVIGRRGRKEVLNGIVNTCTISKTKTYEYYADIVEILCDYGCDEIIPYIVSLPDKLENKEVNDSYIGFVSDCFKKVKNKLTQQEIHMYVDALCAKIKRGECVDASIRAIIDFAKDVSNEKFLEIEATIYAEVNESNCKDVYDIYITNLKQFTKANGNLRHLSDVCLLVIENTNLQNEALETLDKAFSSISKVTKLVGLIVNDVNIDKIKAYKVVRKFLHNKSAANATNSVIAMIRKYGDEIVESILGDEKHVMLERMTTYVVDNTDDVLLDNLLIYIKWLIKQARMRFSQEIHSLLSSAYDMCETEEEHDQVLEIMNSVANY